MSPIDLCTLLASLYRARWPHSRILYSVQKKKAWVGETERWSDTSGCRNIASAGKQVKSSREGESSISVDPVTSYTGWENLQLWEHTVEGKARLCAGLCGLKLSLPVLLNPLLEDTVQHPGVYVPSSILLGDEENHHSQSPRSIPQGVFYVRYMRTVDNVL